MELLGLLRNVRHRNARRLIKAGGLRRIRIHSVSQEPAERPAYVRVAFEFLDPPGPWSIQFYRAWLAQGSWKALEPGLRARFYESEDGARTRVMTLDDGTPILPY